MARNNNIGDVRLELIGNLASIEYKMEGIVKQFSKLSIEDKASTLNQLMRSLKKITDIKEEYINKFSPNNGAENIPFPFEMRDGIPSDTLPIIKKLCMNQTKLANDEVVFLSKKTDEQLKNILRDPIYLKRLKTIV